MDTGGNFQPICCTKIQGQAGHPNQIPYILVWQDLIENLPTWMVPFLPPKIPALRHTDAGEPIKSSAAPQPSPA